MRFIAISFVFLGFVFYQMSGGADFDPVETRNARIDGPIPVETMALAAPEKAPDMSEVSRVSLDLASVTDVLQPTRKLRTTPARATELVPEPAVAEADEVEEVRIVIPSLVSNATPEGAEITPVDFSADAPAVEAAARDIRRVTGSSVNVRGGPGTNYSVVNRLSRGDQVVILEDPGNGWVRLRPQNGGTVGWMADFLLSDS